MPSKKQQMLKRKFLRGKVKYELKRNIKLLEFAIKTESPRSKLMSNVERGRLALQNNKVKELRDAWRELREAGNAQNS